MVGILLLMAAAVVALAPVASAGAGPRLPLVGSLTKGKAVFWNGPFVSKERVDDPSLCGIQGHCFKYYLDVKSSHAKLLRVALRTPDDSNGWALVLDNPAGQEVASGSTYTLHGVAEDFDEELWAHRPVQGIWTIEVVPENVVDATRCRGPCAGLAIVRPGPGD
jgi:hypothetical protein